MLVWHFTSCVLPVDLALRRIILFCNLYVNSVWKFKFRLWQIILGKGHSYQLLVSRLPFFILILHPHFFSPSPNVSDPFFPLFCKKLYYFGEPTPKGPYFLSPHLAHQVTYFCTLVCTCSSAPPPTSAIYDKWWSTWTWSHVWWKQIQGRVSFRNEHNKGVINVWSDPHFSPINHRGDLRDLASYKWKVNLTQRKLYSTLRMDVMSLCILCKARVKCACCCQWAGKYVRDYIKARLKRVRT